MKNLFKNCVSVSESDGWLTPLRFTENQVKTYSRCDAKLIRCKAASSVCLAFKTSAKTISFDYRVAERAREWAFVDVVVGGVLQSSTELSIDGGNVTLQLSGNADLETRVYLPHLVCISIKNIKSDAPLIPTEKREKSWLILGDSITQGMVAKKPSNAYPSLLSEWYECDVLNEGVGGITFDKDELDYLGFEPDIISIALGCNDWGIEREIFETNVREYLNKLVSLYSCRNIYIILPIWRSDGEGIAAGMTFREHSAIIAKVASEYPFIKVIDGYKLVPPMPELFGDPSGRLVHPNDEGFLRYAFALVKEIGNI